MNLTFKKVFFCFLWSWLRQITEVNWHAPISMLIARHFMMNTFLCGEQNKFANKVHLLRTFFFMFYFLCNVFNRNLSDLSKYEQIGVHQWIYIFCFTKTFFIITLETCHIDSSSLFTRINLLNACMDCRPNSSEIQSKTNRPMNEIHTTIAD